MADLSHYNRKRDFTRTREPKGKVGRKTGFHYVIQKHAATRLHYDFRLELDGVLKSWAVTRGPSRDPGDRRLAVEVEDHPLDYGSFEGVIPKGQYGGGTVMLWDEGDWEPIGDPREGLENGDLKFNLKGKRLHGSWALVRMRDRDEDRGRHNWLLIKHRDEAAREGDADALLRDNGTSVSSGRSMDEIATGEGRQAVRGRGGEVGAEKPAPGEKEATPQTPAFIAPELATLADTVPGGDAWVHEVKFDGYRVMALVGDAGVRLMTRNGVDWTDRFGGIAGLLADFPVTTAVLDGEVVAINDRNISSFASLQAALASGRTGGLQYYVFDLLHLDGEDWRDRPLIERKARLQDLMRRAGVDGQAFGGRVIYSEHFTEDAGHVLAHLCRLDMEGVISKRADSTYRSGRNGQWLKIKCHKRQEFVIGGYVASEAGRGFRSLLLGYYEDEKLVYAGKVGTGFSETLLRDIRKRLDGMTVRAMPFVSVTADGKRGAVWVRPELVCEIAFTEWTPDGHLRHPSFKGLRADKPAAEVARDRPVHVEETKSVTTNAGPKPKSGATGVVKVAGMAISHPDRVIFPDSGRTKLDLVRYYENVAPILLPHVAGRPLSMLRCPEGLKGECFFQRHLPARNGGAGQSSPIKDTGIPVRGRNEDYLMIENLKGLVSLAQWGVIELHPWGCMAAAPTLPDKIIFDLDPDPAVQWSDVVAAAFEVKARMEEFRLRAFLKTTGGKGLHVVVPLTPTYGWPPVKAFARAIAESLESDAPDRYVAHASKAARKGKIFVDYLRNDLTATAIAPYAVRARPGAGVAMPLFWDDLSSDLKPGDYTMDTAPGIVAKRLKSPGKDPWRDFAGIDQTLSADWLAALKIAVEPG